MTLLTEEDIALAGEYVLGLLDAATEAKTSARIASDPEFAAEVEAWRERLQPILEGSEEAPPEHVWQYIDQQLPRNSPHSAQDNDAAPLRFWKGMTAITGGVAALLAVTLYLQASPSFDTASEDVAETSMAKASADSAEEVRPTVLVASLAAASGDGSAAVAANYNPATGDLLLTPANLKIQPLYPELWIATLDGQVLSLGMMDEDRPKRLNIDPDLRQYLVDGASIVITPEPQGGAPGGVATGPAILQGKITTI